MNLTSLRPVRLAAPPRRAVRLAVDVALAVGLFVAASAVYRGSTGHVQTADSAYSLVVAEKLLTTGSPDLSGCLAPGGEWPYQLTRHEARPDGVYYGYPLGSSVLSVPWVWDYSRRGLSTVNADGTRNGAIEDQLQLRVAARVSAAVVVLFYVLCRFWCPPLVSLGIAAGFASGSPVWSTMTRALWSHTWMVFWLTAAVVLLAWRARRAGDATRFGWPGQSPRCPGRGFSPPPFVGEVAAGAKRTRRVGGAGGEPAPPPGSPSLADLPHRGGGGEADRGIEDSAPATRNRAHAPGWRPDLLFGVLLGTALFWVVFVRAHGAVSAAAIGVYLLLHHRRTLAVTIVTGGLWSIGLAAVSLHLFGTPTPPSVYAPDTIDGRDVFNRYFWLMLSPSRGLLVFCPYLAAVGVILVGFRKHLTDAGLLLPAGLAVAGHTAVFACYNGWHAGSSYGPRYFCDILPWFVLATAAGCRGLVNAYRAGELRRVVVAVAVLVACFAWGGWVHGRGANSARAWLWNERSKRVGQEESVKEWRHPQFLCGKTFDVNPDGSVRAR